MDRRLASILAVAAILSTLLVFTVFRVSKPEDLTVLRNNYPDFFVKEAAQKGLDLVFSFGLISGRQIDELELRFSSLYERAPVFNPADWEPEEDTSLGEVASHIPCISYLLDKAEKMGWEVHPIRVQVEANSTRYEGIVYDFSRLLGLFCDDETLSRSISVFAILKTGTQIRLFEGSTGFFLSQDDVVNYVTIAVGENKTDYVGREVSKAPFGILRFTDFPKDQKVSVIFEVDVGSEELPQIPMGESNLILLQLVCAYVDGSRVMSVVNPIPIGRVEQ